ncbi:hypothetical protein SAMN04487910_2054 [Aquimarina amphilecti]|uniref:Uncharacterized protein n=1 Tax=Aquimarina amphilecti TaxID=1038014 RepID=A0A1H7NFW0_AQUAM|nr:hypothetical protein [Aquimarina amphilecti]SEL21885.1 hypothetical protein SAMN04487910_2054 [Aquimarina amphilecti]
MTPNIHFSEKQKFSQSWLWILILISGIAPILYLFNSKDIEITTLIIVICSFALVILIFALMKLETIIKNDGIYIRFFPFHIKFTQYNWDTVKQLSIRKYDPIYEYGGWGIRMSFGGKGKAYNVSGNTGLQLEFRNNKKLLIGTNKPDELSEALKKIGKL